MNKLSDEFLISCSKIGLITGNGKGKTTAEKMDDLAAEIQIEQEKHDAIKDGLKSKETKRLKILELVRQRLEISKLPDIPELPETAKSYCKTWIKERLYERRKEFTAKQTTKGTLTESDAIDYLEEQLGWGFAVKNEQKKQDGFMKGVCDVVLEDTIPDIKSSYDCFTFPLFDSVPPDPLNEWQIQGYCNLWNKPKGQVIYVLMDMPEEMIAKEARWKLPQFHTSADYENFRKDYLYSHLPKELRIKAFEFERDEAKIEAIKARVLDCRKYIDSVMETITKKESYVEAL